MKDFIKTLKVFYGFLTKKKFWFTIFIIDAILAGIIAGIIPYFYKLFIEALPGLEYERLLWILLIYAGVLFLELILSSLSFYLGDMVSFSAGVDVRMAIFKHLQNLDFAFHSSKSTGSLISKMKRGDNAFFDLFHAIHHRMLGVIIGFAVMMYFFSAIDIKIVSLVFVAFLVNLVVTKFVVKYNIATRVKFNKEEDKVSGIIVDNIINFETVKLFSRENWERERLEKSFVTWKKRLWDHAISWRILDISVGGLINISIFLILLVALNLAVDLQLEVGEFVLILGFINTFFPRLFELVFSFRNIARNYTDIQKYFGILNYKVEIKDPQNPVKVESVAGEIEFRNTNFSYKDGKKNAVRSVNLRVRQGQSIALVGRSGSGKTTLMKLLMRFYDVDGGSILVDGIDIRNFTKSNLRSFMGVVPQEPILFNNTIGYNIGYGKDNVSQKAIVAAAKIANLDKFINTLSKGYKTDVGERGIKLSGGQKQRLAIARMMLSEPDIIIFDEATSQLDSENEALIQEAFWKVARDKTTIIIAHRLSTAMRADKIIVMENGKIVETGSHKALLRKAKGLYRYFWDLQVNVD